jgi:outer membrane receptor protein involved in Fe transport
VKVFTPLILTALLTTAGRAASAADLILRVVDPQGGSVAGATIEIRSLRRGEPPVAVTTDTDGSAQVPFEPPAEIRVTATGFDPLVQTQETVPQGAVTLRLRPATIHTTIDVVVRDSPALETHLTSVGSALEIEQAGARTVFDAVEKLVPSAFVTRRGVMGYGIATNGTGLVTIRGIGESPNTGVLIVVDGRPDYQGLMGHPLPDFYTLSDAGSVSITQGPASVLYGSNAMGGAIEIKPPSPRPGRHTQLTSSLGSYLTGQHRLNHAGNFGRTYYSLALGVAHTRGERADAAFRDRDAAISLGQSLSEHWKASLQGQFGHFHVEDPGPVQAPLVGSYARVGRGGFSASIDDAYGRTWGYGRLYSSFGHHIITDGFRSVDSTVGFRGHQNFAITPKLTVDGGTDIVRYGGRAHNVISGLNYGEHHLTDAAGFSRVHWTARERLRLNAGFRYEHSSQYGGIIVPEFGVAYRLADKYSVSAAAAKGFRNPTIRELYLFPAPNPLLEPEHLWNYQATFQANPRPSLMTWVTGYYADLNNMIVTTGRYPNLQLLNMGRALNRGLEANVRWQPARRLGFNSGYAYLRSTNLGPYIPRHKLNYSVDWDLRRAFVHLGGMTVGPRWANTSRTSQLGGYTLATLKFTVPAGKNLSVSVFADNLLDRRYEVVTGYPMPGINAMGGIDLRF